MALTWVNSDNRKVPIEWGSLLNLSQIYKLTLFVVILCNHLKRIKGYQMFKRLICASVLILSGCTTTTTTDDSSQVTSNYTSQTVLQITNKTAREKTVKAITQFKVLSTGMGKGSELGRWYISSGANYRSPKTLNIHLSPTVVKQFKAVLGITAVRQLEGRTVKVKGLVKPKKYCIEHGCPKRHFQTTSFKVSDKDYDRRMYIQSQLLVTDIDNITLL